METQAPLRILSLDGGGVRGISSLFILQALMNQITRQQRTDYPNEQRPPLRPCDVFDLICGTSTGGIIALMLGRLEMVIPRLCSLHCYDSQLIENRLLKMPSPNIQPSRKPFSPQSQGRAPRNLITRPSNVV